MSATLNNSESVSEASSGHRKKNASDSSESDCEKPESRSLESRLSLNSDFEKELKQYAAIFSGDEGEENRIGDKHEFKDEDTRLDQGNEYGSDSSSTLSSASSYEFRTKSKKQRSENMTTAEMLEAMDADLQDEPVDRSNWKPRKSIMERVAKRQRKERMAAERASGRAARAARRGEVGAKKKQERWAPY